ncbi:MAG: hypothetical protein WC284_13465 [Candidimonas sp.]
MYKSGYEASVLIKGKEIREYVHDDKIYIEGRKNSEFELKFTNKTGKNILVVPSIDGLSVMDGKPASLESSGYIVSPYGKIIIPGWRLNNDSVAKFTFSDVKQSYAGKTKQDTNNVGVIGFAVFTEKEKKYVAYRSWWMAPTTFDSNGISNYPSRGLGIAPSYDSYSDSAVSASVGSSGTSNRRIDLSNSVQNSLGTGFGEQAEHSVTMVSFEKNPSPSCVMTIYYDSKRGLEARGIDVRGEYAKPVPNAFPANPITGCVPPSDWRA